MYLPIYLHITYLPTYPIPTYFATGTNGDLLFPTCFAENMMVNSFNYDCGFWTALFAPVLFLFNETSDSLFYNVAWKWHYKAILFVKSPIKLFTGSVMGNHCHVPIVGHGWKLGRSCYEESVLTKQEALLARGLEWCIVGPGSSDRGIIRSCGLQALIF